MKTIKTILAKNAQQIVLHVKQIMLIRLYNVIKLAKIQRAII